MFYETLRALLCDRVKIVVLRKGATGRL